MAEKRFLADAAITDNVVQLQRKEKGEKQGTSRTGKVDGRMGKKKEGEEVQRLWIILYVASDFISDSVLNIHGEKPCSQDQNII